MVFKAEWVRLTHASLGRPGEKGSSSSPGSQEGSAAGPRPCNEGLSQGTRPGKACSKRSPKLHVLHAFKPLAIKGVIIPGCVSLDSAAALSGLRAFAHRAPGPARPPACGTAGGGLWPEGAAAPSGSCYLKRGVVLGAALTSRFLGGARKCCQL